MRILLDTNVILDAILRRPPWHKDADAILHAAALGRLTSAVASLSVATVFYVARKVVGTSAARSAVAKCLVAFDILTVDKQTLLVADTLLGSDFEDNILIAAAIASGLDAIVTRNPTDFSGSPIQVWEPAELLKRLAGGSSSSNTGVGPGPGPP